MSFDFSFAKAKLILNDHFITTTVILYLSKYLPKIHFVILHLPQFYESSMEDSKSNSEMKEAWRPWRIFCCRNGYYPLLVATIVTTAFLLDLYTTFGCDFVHVDVGYEPVNPGWNQQKLDLGMFFYNNHDKNTDGGVLMQAFHQGCRRYTPAMNQYFIGADQVWLVSRIISSISGSAGFFATILNWLLVITPLPTCFIWPAILLPAAWVSFLACGAKFLLFGSQIVVSSMWIAGGSTNPTKAVSTSLGMDGVANIIATVLYLISITLICLKSPKRRNMHQPHVSKRGGTFDTDEDLRAPDSMSPHSLSRGSGDIEAQSSKYSIREKEGLAEEIELYHVPKRNGPSYDLGHVQDLRRSSDKPQYTFQSTTFEHMSSFGDKITPLKTNKTKMKSSAQQPTEIQMNSVIESDAFDELASRRTVLFSPIRVAKSTTDTSSASSYNYGIIDQSLDVLVSSMGKWKA